MALSQAGKALLGVMMALAGSSLGLGGEAGLRSGVASNHWFWTQDPYGVTNQATASAPDTNSAAPASLSPQERFVEFATMPRFPRWDFQWHHCLEATTLGLGIETQSGRPVIWNQVGLGMSEAEASAWVLSLSEAVLTNFEDFEFFYRAALVPCYFGGPGLSFGEALETALNQTANGGAWPAFNRGGVVHVLASRWPTMDSVDLSHERAGAEAGPPAIPGGGFPWGGYSGSGGGRVVPAGHPVPGGHGSHQGHGGHGHGGRFR
jgi:hypothetical protein